MDRKNLSLFLVLVFLISLPFLSTVSSYPRDHIYKPKDIIAGEITGIGDMNISNGYNNFFFFNSSTGETEIRTNNLQGNVLDMYNYNTNGWASLDFWSIRKDGSVGKLLTFGAPGMEKIYKDYRGNNYVNSYDSRGFTIQLLGYDIITAFNNSMVCINCRKDYTAQDISHTLDVKGNMSVDESLEIGSNLYVNGNLYVKGCIIYNENTTLGVCV